MKITKLHRDVAEALVTQRATPTEVRSRFRVGPATLAKWQADPDFRALLAEVEARCRRRARWLFVTFAEVAAARLVKLTEAEQPETARKACLDVLGHADIAAKGDEPAEADAPNADAIDPETRQRIYELLVGQAAPPADQTPRAPRRPATVLRPAAVVAVNTQPVLFPL